MKKLKNNGVFYVVISLLGVLAIGTGVLAYTITKNINVQGNYINYEASVPADTVQAQSDQSDQQLSSITGPDYTWDYQNFNGLTTYVKTGGFADATTTLACVLNPFGATSTVDLAEAIITGPSTTTISISVGTSTAAIGNSTSTVGNALSIIPNFAVTANYLGYAINNQNNSQVGVFLGGTVSRMTVGYNQYVCVVAGDGSGSTAGVTNAANTFKGEYKIRFVK